MLRAAASSQFHSDLVIFSPGANRDIRSPLDATDGTVFVFADPLKFDRIAPLLAEEIRRVRGKLIRVEQDAEIPTKYIFDFDTSRSASNQKRLHRIYYYFEQDTFDPSFWPKELADGFDVYYETNVVTSGSVSIPEAKLAAHHDKVARYLREGGFIFVDYPSERLDLLYGGKPGFSELDLSGRDAGFYHLLYKFLASAKSEMRSWMPARSESRSTPESAAHPPSSVAETQRFVRSGQARSFDSPTKKRSVTQDEGTALDLSGTKRSRMSEARMDSEGFWKGLLTGERELGAKLADTDPLYGELLKAGYTAPAVLEANFSRLTPYLDQALRSKGVALVTSGVLSAFRAYFIRWSLLRDEKIMEWFAGRELPRKTILWVYGQLRSRMNDGKIFEFLSTILNDNKEEIRAGAQQKVAEVIRNAVRTRSEARKNKPEISKDTGTWVVTDLKEFTDEQIAEVLDAASERQSEIRLMITDVDFTNPLGKFLRRFAAKHSRIQIAAQSLKTMAQERLRSFKGDLIYLASEHSPVYADEIRSELRLAGIEDRQIVPLAYHGAGAGTLGVGLRDLGEGRLRRQLPNYYARDSRWRYFISDVSVTAPYQQRLQDEVVFRRSA